MAVHSFTDVRRRKKGLSEGWVRDFWNDKGMSRATPSSLKNPPIITTAPVRAPEDFCPTSQESLDRSSHVAGSPASPGHSSHFTFVCNTGT